MAGHEDATELLEMRGISKNFPGVQALRRVDFAARRGEVVGPARRERRGQVDAR